MREIKFRCWDKEYKKMYFDVQGMYDSEPTWYGGFGEIIENDRFVVMQYTGLKDNSGILVFEGDILETVDIPELPAKRREVFWFKSGFNVGSCENEKVIGNIYQNPELLKENYGKHK